MRRARRVSCMEELGVACMVLLGISEGKRPLARPRRRCEDNIKMDFQEVGWGPWTGLVWLRTGKGTGGAGFCKCGYDPSASIKRGVFLL